ncbi:MAG TPA: PEP-utilizing enzyme, partial [Thermomicrobiales bacterium]|nr:PEP-utilizing enzyme [Thermomicrobiales bacterium]
DPTLATLFETENASRLAARLVEIPAGRAFLTEMDRFLDIYGHRETTISLASQPTWKDAPEIVFGLLQGLARAPRPVRGRPDWEIAREEALARPLARLPFVRRLFLKALAAARRAMALREDTHFSLTLPMPTVRRAGLELGRRLRQIGALAAPEDVFHLRVDELAALGRRWPLPQAERDRLRDLVQRRAAKRASLADAPLIDPRLLPAAPIPDGETLVAGTPGSASVAEGPVRLIHSAAEFGTLRPGEVLVAPYTNPAWTPLFQRAAAVVVDTGGAASHAAIVAREYGIPAVMGAAGATMRLVDGQRVRVDGDRGVVLPASGANDEPL